VVDEEVNAPSFERVSCYLKSLESWDHFDLVKRKTFELLTRYLRGPATAAVSPEMKHSVTNFEWKNRMAANEMKLLQDGVVYAPDLEIKIGDTTFLILIFGHPLPASAEERKKQQTFAHELKLLNRGGHYKLKTYFVKAN